MRNRNFYRKAQMKFEDMGLRTEKIRTGFRELRTEYL